MSASQPFVVGNKRPNCRHRRLCYRHVMRAPLLAVAFTLAISLGACVSDAKSQTGWSVESRGPKADDSLVSLFGPTEAVERLEESAKASGWVVVDSGETKGGRRFLLLRRNFDLSQGEKLWDDAQRLGVAIGPMLVTNGS